MKFRALRRYAAIGVTAFLVIAASALFAILIWRIDVVFSVVGKIVGVLMPIIIGFAIAYVLNPLCNFLERHLQKLFKTKPRKKLVHILSVFLSILAFLSVLVGVFLLIIPQLLSSINGLIVSLPGYFRAITEAIENLMANQDNEIIISLTKQVESFIGDMQSSFLSAIPQMSNMLGKVTQGAIDFLSGIMNFIIGIIIAIYMLVSKDKMAAQFKKILYALFQSEKVERFLHWSRESNRIFNGFISGKILDSLIIGILCFIGTSILQIPYALLVSVIIGISNIIPFFGPFIGAIPCGIFILLADPLKCLWFIIFVIILQQVDGNIIGPKIVGESTGLSAFWVIFAITVGGGLFGILGMFVGVPVFAIIYTIARTLTEQRLLSKKMPAETEDYIGLQKPSSGKNDEKEKTNSQEPSATD